MSKRVMNGQDFGNIPRMLVWVVEKVAVCIVQERGDLLCMYVGMLLIEYKIKIIKKIVCVCCCCGVAPPKRGKN